MIRESFENANRLLAHAHGDSEDGAKAQSAAVLAIHANIEFGIVTAEQQPGLHTLSGKTGSHLQARADGRGIRTGTGATNHEIRICVGERNGRPGSTNQRVGALGNQTQSRGEIGTEGFHLALHSGDGGKRVGVVGARRNLFERGGSGKVRLSVGHTRHHVYEQPFAQSGQRLGRQFGKMKAGSPRRVRPDHLAGGVDMFRAIGQVEAQIYAPADFQGLMTLDGNAVFADVNNLVQIEHRALGFRGKRGIGRSLDFMTHTPTAVG